MAITQWINLQIKVSNSGVARAGFGIPLIPSHNANVHGGWAPGYVHTYSGPADVLADGFAASSPEYLAASAIFAQSPHPTKVLIGRCASAIRMVWQLKAQQVLDSTQYQVQVDGEGVTSTLATLTSGVGATKEQIHDALRTQLNAVVGKNYAVAFSPLAIGLAGLAVTGDAATNELHHVAHGWNTGDGPIQFTNSGGAVPAGINLLTDYWVIKVDADNIKIATSLALALVGTEVDLTTNGTGTTTATPDGGALSPTLPLLATGSANGNWFCFEPISPLLVNVQETTADPGIAADLAAIQKENNTWYAVASLYKSKACVLATAAYAETNSKEYITDVNDTDAISTALGNGDTGDSLVGHGYTHTLCQWHHSPKEFLSCAALGRLLPLNPGLWVYAFKTFAGPTPSQLDATQRQHLIDRRMGAYTFEGDRSVTWDGKVGSTVNNFIDVAVGLDWFADDVVKSIAGVLFGNDKVEFTDEGISKIANAVRGSVERAVSDEHKVFAPGDPTNPDPTADPVPSVFFPKVADIDPSQRALRNLPNGTITARLAGAVQTVGIIATVTF